MPKSNEGAASGLRWLQFGLRADLAHGLGGVEVHARSLDRELKRMGVDSRISSDPADLERHWDVIHTHGSEGPVHIPDGSPSKNAIRVITLHGTTLGRMHACREWLWLGGYAAAARESSAVARADVVLSVHPRLHLYSLARSLGELSAPRPLRKTAVVCGNGWDSGEATEPLPQPVESWIQSRIHRGEPLPWVFIGRGDDPVKGADRMTELMEARLRDRPMDGFLWVPGDGAPVNRETMQVMTSGRLTPGQIRGLLARSRGLIIPSRYEGLPLVVLEALAMGTPVVAAPAGGITTLSRDLHGLILCKSGDPGDLARGLESVPVAQDATREEASELNRKVIPTWQQVAETCLKAVQNAAKPARVAP